MAEERVLIPPPFVGSIEEDPAEFWRRTETFVDYKAMGEAEQLKLAKAMLIGGAQDWLEKLDAGEEQHDQSQMSACIFRLTLPYKAKTQ